MIADPMAPTCSRRRGPRAHTLAGPIVGALLLTIVVGRAETAGADGTGQRITVEIPPHTRPATGTGVGPAGLLPRTGAAFALWLLTLAVALIVVGAAIVIAGRRRRRRSVGMTHAAAPPPTA